MIKTSEEYLVMVSPYIKPWGHLETQLQNCVQRKVNVQLYYRADKEKEMKKFINKLKKIGIQLEPIDTLHAKIYLSEKMGVMNSMNLHDFSKSASREVGLVTDQRGTLKEFKGYIEDLINKPIIPKKGFMDMGKEFLINKFSGEDDNEQEEKAVSEVVKNNRNTSSKLLTTKELSELTGKSSRKINNWLNDNRLMYKKDGDWMVTKKGKDVGGVVKNGQWGKFVVWPESIAEQIK